MVEQSLARHRTGTESGCFILDRSAVERLVRMMCRCVPEGSDKKPRTIRIELEMTDGRKFAAGLDELDELPFSALKTRKCFAVQTCCGADAVFVRFGLNDRAYAFYSIRHESAVTVEAELNELLGSTTTWYSGLYSGLGNALHGAAFALLPAAIAACALLHLQLTPRLVLALAGWSGVCLAVIFRHRLFPAPRICFGFENERQIRIEKLRRIVGGAIGAMFLVAAGDVIKDIVVGGHDRVDHVRSDAATVAPSPEAGAAAERADRSPGGG